MGSRKHYIIMTNRPKDPELKVTDRIRRYLEERGAGCTVYADNESSKQLQAEFGETLKACCMVVLGGDGTMLKAARETADSNIPLLGINLGTMGYLTEVEPAGIESALEKLLSGTYCIEKRMMLTGSVYRSNEELPEYVTCDALNDVTVTRRGAMQVVNFRIWVNGQVLYTYGADGIVLSTPTGSTGYNMSAGGPIVEPSASMILLTPVCPHTLNARSIVLSPDDEIEVEIGEKLSGQTQEAEVNFDGSGSLLLGTGDRIRVVRSQRTVSVIRLSELSFLERLHRKMSE